MKRTANVIGGGIGGLATAACLAQAGFHVRVFERAAELREIGAGIFLKENSLRVLERLGRLDWVERAGSPLRWAELWSRGGVKILSRPIASHRVFVLPRQELHAMLLSAAMEAGVEILSSAELADASADATITLSDGRRFEADVTVGADGAYSAVRGRLGLGNDVRRTGAGSWRTLVPFAEGDPADEVIEYWNGHRRILVVPSGEGITYICASSRDDDSETSGETFEKAVWAASFPQFAGLIDRISPESITRRRHIKTRVSTWHNGRVAILGDAVHGQPPNLGQGAGMAITNAAGIARHLTQASSVEAALASWETEGRPFTEAVQAWSNNYDDVAHAWPRALEPARNVFIRAVGRLPATRRRWMALGQGLPELLSRSGKVSTQVAGKDRVT